MRKLQTILFMLFAVVLLNACSSSYFIAPPYTSVDKIINVKAGMTMQQANAVLGITPYDVFHIQDDGSSIVTYKYRIADRRQKFTGTQQKIERDKHSEISQTGGETWYQKEDHTLFVLMRDGKVRSMLTDNGIKYSRVILFEDNDIRFITKEELSRYSEYYMKLDVEKVEKRRSVGEEEKKAENPFELLGKKKKYK